MAGKTAYPEYGRAGVRYAPVFADQGQRGIGTGAPILAPRVLSQY